MSYNYPVDRLWDSLLVRADREKVKRLIEQHRKVRDGLLPVGLKLHVVRGAHLFDQLVNDLGGHKNVIAVNYYRHSDAALTLVLPPMGSAEAAISLVERIGEAVGCDIFSQRDFHIQVCTAGRLHGPRPAYLAIGFYLGSDVQRRYQLDEFKTTFSEAGEYSRGRRLVLYDAPNGGHVFDRRFDYWRGVAEQALIVAKELPFTYERTDLLLAKSPIDIRNINLIASLLVHRQSIDGFWRLMGIRFEEAMGAMLERHGLTHILNAPWIRRSKSKGKNDNAFYEALKRLMDYTLGEKTAPTIPTPRAVLSWFEPRTDFRAPRHGLILHETHELLEGYRDRITEESRFANEGGLQ